MLANLLDLDVDVSSNSYVAERSTADPGVLTKAATSVLHAVNTIAAGLGLDDADKPSDVARGVTNTARPRRGKTRRARTRRRSAAGSSGGRRPLALKLARKLLPTHATAAEFTASDAQ